MSVNAYDLMIAMKAIDHVSGVLRQIQAETDRTAQRMSRIERASRTLDVAGKRMAKVGAGMVAAGAGAAAATLGFMQPVFAVEDALAKVRSMPGMTEAQVRATQAAALEWSKVHADTAESFVNTSYMMYSANLKGNAAIEATKTGLAVAKATMGEGTAAANLLATLYSQMGDQSAKVATEMQRLGDIVTITQQSFQIKDLHQLNEGFKKGIPAGKMFGQTAAEVAVALGQLNSAGLQGAESGAAYESLLIRMLEASKRLHFQIVRNESGKTDLIGTVQALENQFGNLADMSPRRQEKFQQAFGDQALRAISLLMGKSRDMAVALKGVNTQLGATSKAQRIIEATNRQQYLVAKNAWIAEQIKAAQKYLPLMTAGLRQATALADKAGRFAEAHPDLVKWVIGGGAATAAGLIGVGLPLMALGGMASLTSKGLKLSSTVAAFFRRGGQRGVPVLPGAPALPAPGAAALAGGLAPTPVIVTNWPPGALAGGLGGSAASSAGLAATTGRFGKLLGVLGRVGKLALGIGGPLGILAWILWEMSERVSPEEAKRFEEAKARVPVMVQQAQAEAEKMGGAVAAQVQAGLERAGMLRPANPQAPVRPTGTYADMGLKLTVPTAPVPPKPLEPVAGSPRDQSVKIDYRPNITIHGGGRAWPEDKADMATQLRTQVVDLERMAWRLTNRQQRKAY